MSKLFLGNEKYIYQEKSSFLANAALYFCINPKSCKESKRMKLFSSGGSVSICISAFYKEGTLTIFAGSESCSNNGFLYKAKVNKTPQVSVYVKINSGSVSSLKVNNVDAKRITNALFCVEDSEAVYLFGNSINENFVGEAFSFAAWKSWLSDSEESSLLNSGLNQLLPTPLILIKFEDMYPLPSKITQV